MSKDNEVRPIATITNEDLEKLKQSRIPENTKRRVNWAVKMFREWHGKWKVRLDSVLKVYKELEEMNTGEIDYCLQYFLPEIRKQNGEKFPSKSYKEIISSFQHFLNNTLNLKCSIFTDKEFTETRKVLDAQMKEAGSEGMNVPPQRSHSISLEDEERLWNSGAFGCSNPRQLLDTLIYYLGIHLSLRASQEHRNLMYGPKSQLQLLLNENGVKFLEYAERNSKSMRCGLKDIRREPKTTRVYPNEENPDRCLIKFYELYLSKRPEAHGRKGHEAFYLAPMSSPNEVWFKASPLGIHTIEKTTARLMSAIKFPEKEGQGGNENKHDLHPHRKRAIYTNSSLRRTAQMRLMNANIPPAIIQKKTGRISTTATQAYIEEENYEISMTNALYSGYEESNSGKIVGKPGESSMGESIFSGNQQFHNCTFNIYK